MRHVKRKMAAMLAAVLMLSSVPVTAAGAVPLTGADTAADSSLPAGEDAGVKLQRGLQRSFLRR